MVINLKSSACVIFFLDIFFSNLDGFKDLLPMLGGFHMVKAAWHAIGKYVKESGLDDILKYAKVYGQKH